MIEAMKLALEALEQWTTPHWAGTGVDKANAAHAALRTAIAEAESVEPVAWMYGCVGRGRMYAEELDDPAGWQPLYTTPPAAQRQPLTEEEIEKIIKNNMTFQMNLAGIRQDFEAAHGIGEKK